MTPCKSTRCVLVFFLVFAVLVFSHSLRAQSPAQRPNILVIFGDDIGQANISRYTHGVVGHMTPNMNSECHRDLVARTPNKYRRLAPLSSLLLIQMLVGSAALAQTQATSPGQAKQVAPAPSIQGDAWTGDLDGMLKRHYIRALVAYSKTQYYVVKGVQRGSSYEFLKAFEDAINRKYPNKQKNIKFHVVFVPVPRGKMFSRLAEGRGDIAVGALTVTPDRLKLVDFSDPLVVGVKQIAITGPQSPALNTLDDLSGKEVFARQSSSAWEHLQALNAKFKSEGKPLIKLRAAPEDLEDEDIFEMLNAGLVQIAVSDAYLPKLWQQILPNIRPHDNIVVSDSDSIAWALRKNTPQLMSAVNDFVRTHKRGTAFGNSVIQKYEINTQALKNAISPVELKNFEDTVALFRKYSTQYNVDYLLMMAQGFQESGLNQEAKSKVGAVGVMQLMPATGQQMQVGDISQIEANVHAGLKYIRFMVDKYFANEPMTDTNKLLFVFAAYNAGPGRVHALRAEAAQKGFDPNVWIDNVEVIAAARIGMETVTYVPNIYKYYVAYKLLAEQEEERNKTKQQLQQKPSH
jgi:membrane-bound lytic murein transglycosylase MltF